MRILIVLISLLIVGCESNQVGDSSERSQEINGIYQFSDSNFSTLLNSLPEIIEGDLYINNVISSTNVSLLKNLKTITGTLRVTNTTYSSVQDLLPNLSSVQTLEMTNTHFSGASGFNQIRINQNAIFSGNTIPEGEVNFINVNYNKKSQKGIGLTKPCVCRPRGTSKKTTKPDVLIKQVQSAFALDEECIKQCTD